MEDRLLPINALLGLLLPNDLGPPELADAGFQLAGLEIPAGGPDGSVVIDVLLFHAETNHLVQVEAKSGANIEDAQAVRYGRLNVRDVVRSAYVTLPGRTPPTSETAYLCLAEHGDRVRLGLEKAGLAYPIMKVSSEAVDLDRTGPVSRQLAQAFAERPISLAGPPPRLIPFDEDSDIEVIKPFVLPVLVEATSHRLTQLSLNSLAERASPHLGLYGRRAQHRIRKKVAEAARQLAAAEPSRFQYLHATGSREALVKIVSSPEDRDPRGRTQAYQAVGRQGIGGKSATKRPWHPDQLDLLAELGLSDNESGEEPDPSELVREQ